MKILQESPLNQPPPLQIGKRFKCNSCKTKYEIESQEDYTVTKVLGSPVYEGYERPHFQFKTKCPHCDNLESWRKYV